MSDTERDMQRWKDEQLHIRGQCEKGCVVCENEISLENDGDLEIAEVANEN